MVSIAPEATTVGLVDLDPTCVRLTLRLGLRDRPFDDTPSAQVQVTGRAHSALHIGKV